MATTSHFNKRGIDMAKTLTATAKRILNAVKKDLSTNEQTVAEPILADAHPEDLVNVDPQALAAAVKLTAKSLAAHSKGKSLVEVTSSTSENGEAVTIVSIVNEDMPFLFDSVLGQINDSVDDVRMVVHPVLDVAHAGKSFEVVDKTRPGLAREKTLRTSVIMAVLAPLGDTENKKLLKEIKSTLSQVNDAVRDWHPMQAKMDDLVSTLKEGVTPARKSDVEEALEFLTWLRDNNFTFLGVREYDYVGGEKRGQLVRADAPALGILSDPAIRVMQRGDQQMTTTDEIRAFLNS
ncbi:MAG: NAD-glutamate dehydrogenase, partial [Pseudomonadota bacterium]